MSYVITEVFREIVEKVSEAILTDLQATDNNITGIHFQHGSIAEISETMRQLDQDRSTAVTKYPVIILEEDIEHDRRNTDYDCIVRLRVIIAHHTKEDLKSAARESYTFSPVLRPIYQALLEEISWHPAFVDSHPEAIEHRCTERKSWGRHFSGKEQVPNRFTDYVDAIELTDLTLTVEHDYH